MIVTILVPCHDEEAALPALARDLALLPGLLRPERFPEVLLVDDGSRDATLHGLTRMADGLDFPARVVGLAPNRGIGAAIREAAPMAGGEVVVTYDADRPYAVEDVVRLVQTLVEGGHDVVSASPWHPEGASHGLPFHRGLLSRAASALYALRLGRRARGLHTFTCGFRAYRREMLLRCLPARNGFAATAEILLNALRAGASVAEVPAVLRRRTAGSSKLRALRTACSHLGLLARG